MNSDSSDDDDYTPAQQEPESESDDEMVIDKAELKREIQELKAEEQAAKKIDFTAVSLSWNQFTANLESSKSSAPVLDLELDSSQHGLPLMFKSLATAEPANSDLTPPTSPTGRAVSPLKRQIPSNLSCCDNDYEYCPSL
jgi:hypothetical protein